MDKDLEGESERVFKYLQGSDGKARPEKVVITACALQIFKILLTGIAIFFSQPVADAEVPADVAREFDSGKPWPISGLVR